MHLINDEKIKNYAETKSYYFPSSLDINCPNCGSIVNFRLDKWSYNRRVRSGFSRNRCPRCDENARFFYVDPVKESGSNNVSELYISPKPQNTVKPYFEENELKIDDSIKRAYKSALKAYEVGLWEASAVSCGKVLEGMMHDILEEKHLKKPLYEQLKILPEKRDLKQPIITLANTIRKGRNLGAHFDLEIETDREVAKQMLDLLNYLLEYLFVLPQRIEDLEERVSKS
jgi:hypothetical protein